MFIRKQHQTPRGLKHGTTSFWRRSVLKGHGGGRQRVSDEKVENVRKAFIRSPRKSIRRASRELQMPRATVHKVLRKRLRLCAYKVQILQELKPEDKPRRHSFACDMLDRIDRDPNFLTNIMFSDEATFHVSGAVNRHNVRIWGSQQPHSVMEHVRDSPKVNVWCGVMCNMIIRPFFFAEKIVTGSSYLDMLQLYAFPQLEHLQPSVFFSTRRCSTPLVARRAASSECNISRPLDRTRWTNGLASTFP